MAERASRVTRRRAGVDRRRAAGLWALAAPAVVLVFLFHYVPFYGILISFRDFTPYLGMFRSPWAGLEHFRYFLGDPKFWSVLRNTLLISVLDLAFGFPAPIVFALLANEIGSRSFKRAMQTISYLPHFVSWVVVFGIFYQFLSPSYGVLMRFVAALGAKPPNVMAMPGLFRPLVVSLEIWKEVGWGAILYFAALAAVDEQLYEAAYIDGAGRWRMVSSVTIPGILPMIALLLVFRVSGLFSVGFDRIFVFSNPLNYEVSDVIGTYVYRLGLIQAQYSRSAAIGFSQSLISFALLYGANRLTGRVAGVALW